MTDTPPSIWTRFRAGGPVLGLLSLLGLFAVLLVARGQFANFFSVSNMQVLLHKNSVPAVVALGMLLVVVSGGIDLSVGSVVALVTVVTMQVFRLVHDGPEVTSPGAACCGRARTPPAGRASPPFRRGSASARCAGWSTGWS